MNIGYKNNFQKIKILKNGTTKTITINLIRYDNRAKIKNNK